MSDVLPGLSVEGRITKITEALYETPRIGLVGGVTHNLLLDGKYEEALTYLLGAQDAYAAVPVEHAQQVTAIRTAREEIKKYFRKNTVDIITPDR